MLALLDNDVTGLGQPTVPNRLFGIKTWLLMMRRAYVAPIKALTTGLFTTDQIRRIIMGMSGDLRAFDRIVLAEVAKAKARLGKTRNFYIRVSQATGRSGIYEGQGLAKIIQQGTLGSSGFWWVLSNNYATKEQLATFVNVAANPTQEEITELAAIDNFFQGPAAPEGVERDNPFFYPPGWVQQRLSPLLIGSSIRYTNQIKQTQATSFGLGNKFWKLKESGLWGKIKPQVVNAEIVESLWYQYPWPVPPVYFFTFYIPAARRVINEIVKQDSVIDPGSYRTLLTLSILEHYNSVMVQINKYFKRKAKKKKRQAIIKAIILVVVGIIFAAALPAILALAYSAGKSILSATQKRKAAKDLVKAAKQFEKDNAAFAAEIMRVAEELDAEAAAEEAAAKESPEETGALIEGEGEFTLIIEGTPVLKSEDLDTIIKEGIARSVPGDRLEATFEGKSTGLYIRTGTTLVKVPPEAEAGVRAASREEILGTVTAAESRVTPPKKEAGLPWWLLIPAAAVIL